MTCIVALKENNEIYIGADSIATSGSVIFHRSDQKIFRNGEFLIGGCGSPRTKQILQYTVFPECDDWDVEKYMCTKFVDTIRTNLYNMGNIEISHNIQSTDGSSFIVIFKNRIFILESDFQIMWSESPFTSVGSGREVAFGAMDVLIDLNLSTKEKILKTLQTTSKYINSVGGNIIIEKY